MNINRGQRRCLVLVLVSIMLIVFVPRFTKSPDTIQQARLEMLQRLVGNAENNPRSLGKGCDLVRMGGGHDYILTWDESSSSDNNWLTVRHSLNNCQDCILRRERNSNK